MAASKRENASKPWRRAVKSGRDEVTWSVMSVTSSEASGPSGAGSRADASRNPRGSEEMRLTVPRLRSRRA
ncbi:hypothetical protein L2K70_11140 [Nocardioides KLBMP 9356]|uniref:Uncharacterized protein n=1 Tax=Nocardioides potassii TaxID=2911371 RepID=A0ABS9HAD0_9ACTN|nr:hypothetical protein [Nocardioides potassii]MCF6378157.1 hypothetical protein [Nocardioides potassii]